jgi:hypothetical protein
MRLQSSRYGSVVIAATPPSAILKTTASTSVVTSEVASASHPSTASAAASEGGPTTIPTSSHAVLPGGCRTRFGHPVGPWHLMPRSLTGGLEDAARSLLAARFAAQLVGIRDDHLHNSRVPAGSGVHWVIQPQPVALLVHLWHTEARVLDHKSAQTTGKEKVLIVVPALR